MPLGSPLRFKRFSKLVSVAVVCALSPLPELLAQGSPAAITLTASATPGAAEPAVTVVTLTGSGFPSGAINAADVQVQLQPSPSGAGPAMVGVVLGVTSVYGSTRRVTFQAFPSNSANNVKTPTAYLASLTGMTTAGIAFASGNASSVTLNPPATIFSVSPSAGAPGGSATVTMKGLYSNFFQGSSQANFGPGISVGGAAAGSFGPITVVDATTATAQVAFSSSAVPAVNDVTVRTGVELATLTRGFTISATPAITAITPNTGLQGQQALSVNVTGQFTHFLQGTTAISFGAAVTVASLTVTSATFATAVLNIAPNAATGPRDVTVTTGAEVATLANGFAVTAGTPVLTQLNPNTGQQSQQNLSVTLTGQFTHFVQGASVASFGAGITISSLTVNSATSAVAVLNISSTAVAGSRNVSVTTGTEVVTLTNGFTVTNGTPVLTQVNPNTGQQSQQNLSVTLTGQFTHFVQGASVASFGAGITVSSLTVSSATSAVAVLNISATAAAGSRNVSVTTGTEVVTLTNGFTVTNGTPVLTQVNPNTGQQSQQNLSVTLTGQFTHFVQGTSVASFGAGITVSSLTVSSAMSAVAVITIAATAAAGARNVSVTTGTEAVTLTNGFTVTNGTPVLTQVNPNTGQQSQQNLSVTLTGQFTHFVQGASVASFGAGITVSSLTVSSATSAVAVLNISATAAAGSRNVSVTTGTEAVTLTNGFTVTNGTPVLTQVNPNTGQQSQQNLSVTLTGQFTHFVQGASVASFGAGITISSLTVNSATSAVAVLNIAATAAAGSRNVSVTTGTEAVTLTNGFTVTNGTPVLTQVNPNTGQQNQQNLSVTLTGQFTHFVQGTSVASFGAGVSVASLTVNSATTATAVLSISATAAAGLRSVTVTTGAEIAALTNGFTVTNGTPVLTQVSPNTGQQGQQNISVALTGQYTHFVQGTTTASFGAGITVASLTANSATSATALLNIAVTAAIGTRSVSLTTGGEVVTLPNGFSVTNGVPALTQVSPNTGQQQPVIGPLAPTITFDNPPPGLTPNNYIQGSPVGASSELTNQFQNAGAVFSTFGGAPYAALIDLTGQAPSGTNGIGAVNSAGNLDYTQDMDIFLVVPGTATPAVTDFISIQGDEIPIAGNVIFSAYDVNGTLLASGTQPDSAGGVYSLSAPGIHEFRLHSESGTVAYDNLSFDEPVAPSTLSVSLTGQFTHFVQGTTTASFGAGITVASLTVNSATSATAVLNISTAAAAVGVRNVTVTTGAEVVKLANGFTVIAGTPVLTHVTPGTGFQGQQNLFVALAGQFTPFVQGTSVASFGAGITVASLTVNSPTSATAVVNIAANAAMVARNVSVTTGAEVVTLANAFKVTNEAPVLTQVDPNTGLQGQQSLSVALTGQYTHFGQGITGASFGPDITVASVIVVSLTSATAVLNIAANAAPGTRNVTVTSGAEVVTLTNGFTVIGGAPVLTRVNPNTGPQGQTGLSVALTGQFTHWVQGTTTASFGAGITVSSLTVNSATSATALLTIASTAVVGPANVTVTTGAEVVTLTNGFTVTAGAPALTQVNPASGQQGQSGLSVALTGQNTHWVQGTTTAGFGAGITVSNLTVNSATSATALLSIASTAAVGPANVTVTTAAEVVTLTNGFTVTAGAPVLTEINPASGQQGQTSLLVTLTGQNTHFALSSVVSFTGSGISAGAPSAATSTSLTVAIAIASNATLGPSDVQVVTGAERVSLNAGFTILSGSGTPGITSVTPGSALPSQSIQVTIVGRTTHFVNGVTTANLGPGVSVGGGLAGAFGPVKVTSPTTAVAQISIPANSPLGSRTVVMQTNSEQASLVNGFQVAGPPSLLSVMPSSGKPGQTLAVTVTGAYTHFQNGLTQANFGAGISVGGGAIGAAGPVTVTSATSATAQLTIASSAAVGLRSPLVSTGAEQASLAGGFLVLGTVTGPHPTVTITSPTEGSQITSLTTVTGTAASPNLASWILEYQGSSSTLFTQFAHGNSSTVSGSFDPSMLLNGLTTIRLTATDTSGQTASTAVDVVLSRNVKVGNFTLSFVDVSVPVAGLPIEVVRTYDSRMKSSGDFGFGWNVSYNTVFIQVNGLLGDSWSESQSGGLIPNYCLVPPSNLVVSIRLQNGVEYQFSPVASSDTRCSELIPPETADIAFVPVGNTPPNATLSAPAATGLFVNGAFPDPVQLLDSDTLLPVDPDQYILTLPNGQQLQISRTFGLQTITDRNGNTLTFGANGVTSSNGVSVAFTRDSLNRITTITDPNGNVHNYTYSASGDLASSVDPLKNTSTYSYDGAHDLTSFTDPSGNQPVRSVYDDSGRLIQVIDAFGHVTDLTHNVAASTETVSDQLGRETTYVYDSHGNVTSITDPLGNVTTSTYDANDNLLSETDPLGHTTTFTYDANNNRLTQTDALGHTTKQTYDAYGNLLSTTDPNGNKRINTYDANGNVLTTTDALGNTTTWAYDSRGNPTSMTDALGRTVNYSYDASGNLTALKNPAGGVSTFSLDANGNRTAQTDPLGRTTQFAYDANNNLISTTNPDGTTSLRTFNANGLRTSDTDELNRTTSYAYDVGGHVAQISYPDGTTVAATYDPTGRRTQLTGRSGVSTSFTYDAGGRAVATLNSANGATTQTVYDADGNVLSVLDPLGNKTHYSYDTNNRRASITDVLAHTTAFVYDAAGNQISSTDANGKVTTHQFDSDNRAVKTVYPDGSSDQATFDAMGQLLSKTDSTGKVTHYAYDNVGNLISVTDALGKTTTYGYDAGGNRISQTDANSRTTTFTYDSRNRRIGRTLPGGQSETFLYDNAGNVISHTDFNGKVTTYNYDPSNHVLAKIPDASFGAPSIFYTYLPSGLRSTMTDGTGVTSYVYDSADRLNQVNRPSGALSYSYDILGNLSSLTTGKGTKVTYAYDQINRLATVSEANTGTTTYTYDNVSNVAAVAYGNGVTHSFSSNSKNQLTTLTVKAGSSTIASYGYTLDSAGHRLSVAELGGRLVNYTYDNVYRLTSETVSGAPTGPNGAISYSYDAVGNRTQLSSTLAAVPTQSYTYDPDDRLTADTYDPNGNTTLSGGIAGVYDFENHLLKQGSITMTYDGDGNRVSKTIGGVTTTYLVDEKNPTGFPQVVEESSSDGSTRTFVYGLQRISQRQFVASSNTVLTSFYVYDGHGSVRALANAAGAVTDTYDYDAFGNLIHSTGSTPNEFLFAGEQFDSDLGLYYNRARYLKTSTGRFMTMDTIEGDPQSPATLHKYVYTGDDPVDARDPGGNEFDIGSVMESIAISSSLDSISTAVLNSPLGSSALGWVASHLLPGGLFNALQTLKPDAGLLGGSISFNTKVPKVPLGLTAGFGLEFLVGTGTAQIAAYGYYGGGISFGATTTSVGWSGYAGAVYNAASSGGYTGNFVTVTVPIAVIQNKLRSKIETDWQLAEMSVASTIVYLPQQVVWIIQTELQFVQVPLPTSNFAINLFTDPKNFGGDITNSFGFSVAYGKSFTSSSSSNIALTWTYYWQLAPPWSLPLSPCDDCSGGQDVPFQ